ncbi:MAG: hypothetical protein ABF289_17485, partial [Clostridiales bacterium]
MKSLVKLEFKKIFSIKSFNVACCLCIIYILVLSIGGINIKEHYDKTNNKTKSIDTINGFEAIKLKKKNIKGKEGYLDENKIKETINYYKKLKSDKENLDETDKNTLSSFAYAKYWLPYIDISEIVAMSYSLKLYTYEGNIIDKLNDNAAKDFYKNRTTKIEGYLKPDSGLKIDKTDKEAIVNLSKKMKYPLYYEYYDGWSNLLDKFFYLNIIVILVICFGIAFAFTMEFENGMIMIILSTVNGRNKLSMAKIKASIIFSSVIYLFMNFIYMILTFIFYGYSGWNCAIQIKSSNWLSIYNLNFYQAYILGIIIGLGICIFMAMATLLFACIFKKAVLSISISMALLLAPLLIDQTNQPNIITILIEFLPIKALNYTFMIRQFSFYNIFGYTIQRCYAMPLFFGLFTLLIIPFIVKSYK